MSCVSHGGVKVEASVKDRRLVTCSSPRCVKYGQPGPGTRTSGTRGHTPVYKAHGQTGSATCASRTGDRDGSVKGDSEWSKECAEIRDGSHPPRRAFTAWELKTQRDLGISCQLRNSCYLQPCRERPVALQPGPWGGVGLLAPARTFDGAFAEPLGSEKQARKGRTRAPSPACLLCVGFGVTAHSNCI